jgi:hypothetical protein
MDGTGVAAAIALLGAVCISIWRSLSFTCSALVV